MANNSIETRKVVVFGDVGVGKTQLLRRWLHDKFSTKGPKTKGMDFEKKNFAPMISQPAITRPFTLEVWDLPGEKELQIMLRMYFSKIDAVILVFSHSNEASFLALQQHLATIKEYTQQTCKPIFLVGNKSDLLDVEQQNTLSDQAREFALINNLVYLDVSAKTGWNISAFETAILERICNTPVAVKPITPHALKNSPSKLNIQFTIALFENQMICRANLPIQKICEILRSGVNESDRQKYFTSKIPALQKQLDTLRWTSKSLCNTTINLIITALLILSVVGFPLAYFSGQLQKNQQTKGHALMFFAFGEKQISQVKCNEIFAQTSIELRV